MSHYRIHIEADNDAFAGDSFGPEIARILTEAAKHANHLSADEDRETEGTATFRDSNGNKVASVYWTTNAA